VQAEEMAGRKISCKVVIPQEKEKYLSTFKPSDLLLLWDNSEV
jgi:hypothetical protein